MKNLFLVVSLVLTGCNIKGNSAPIPEIVEIPASAHPKEAITIKVRAVDPNGDYVSIRVDFGDGKISDFSEWVKSGSIVVFEHQYIARGNYYVTVQAKDSEQNYSLWSSGRPIVIE